MMEKFKWTYKELLNTPLEVVLYIAFIQGTKSDRDDLQRKKEEEKNRT